MLRLYFKPVSWSRTAGRARKSVWNASSKTSMALSKQCTSNLQQTCRLLMLSSSSLLTCRKYFCTGQQLSEADYEILADETLDSLTEIFEDLPEKFDLDPDYDVTLNNGVLTVKVSNSWGTYVINKQVPNKQIWLSSPKSGPKRYDYIDGVWIYKHDNSTLHNLLNKEVSDAIGQAVDFTLCSYGQR